MQQTRIVFYRELSGRVPMQRWLDKVPKNSQTECRRARVGRVRYRMFYFWHGGAAVFSHGIAKKESAVSQRALHRVLARKRGLSKTQPYTHKKTTMPKENTTPDAVEIMHRRYFEDNPDMMEMLAAARISGNIAHHIYNLRASTGQTQEEFGELVGVDPIIINDIEESDYAGDSFAVLAHIEKILLAQMPFLPFPLKGVYPNVLLGATMTGLKVTLFRYHPGRIALTNGTPTAESPAMLQETYVREHLRNELHPWQHALALNRQELKMFALAGMNEWCHLNGGLRVNLSGNPDEYLRAVDTHSQLIDAIFHYIDIGERTALKHWQQDMGTREQARYIAELESALNGKTFEALPDAEWLAQTLIAFVRIKDTECFSP